MRIIKYVMFLCVVLIALPVQAAERTISIDGVGEVSAKPDTVELRVAVIGNAASAAVAMTTASNKAAAVLKKLSAHGIADKDIQTGSVSLNPVYQRNQNNQQQEPKVIGYRAAIDNLVRLRAMESLGKVIDDLLQAGADRLDGIHFFLADTDALMAEARKKAVKDALAKAAQLSTAAGVELGQVISITDAAAGGPLPQQRMMAISSARAGAPVMPGEIRIMVRVHMVMAIR
ncbi:MAG: SIMPL domain-containing protein [Rhodospirillaceae bacterium]|nr:SIMPL domain-containing protein [Rhodospirillaceae bacterium]MBT5242628.1 SIMPL domain-containing protein [Rhodospirillaceae bacterium]MBT5562791.1 SIMPL domain-containing protein [Rhodospirillaceae bacterium]MBT6241220.1 SIMPL domain-containing protein [Rhodospirillaceae bacterium]MBT7137509.1 SIMPL domain-containing protein [Rhodospirillaceae bacterium]